MNKNIIEVYTDGACSGNPGKGGWAAILLYKNHKKILSGGYLKTTNNRMELTAVIEALKSIKNKNIPLIVYADSQYVVENINKGHLYHWVKKNFLNVKNSDLWKELYALINQFKDIKFIWIKGHNNHPLNDECDALAVQAYMSKDLKHDEFYEKYILKNSSGT